MDKKKWVDGDSLGNGVVFSGRGGFSVGVYRCHCGREQTAENEYFPGGLSENIAAQFGWERTGDSWECPFCSDNEDKLRQIFDAPPPPQIQ